MKRNEAFVVCSCLFIVVLHVYKFPLYIFDHWPQGWAGGRWRIRKSSHFVSQQPIFWLSVSSQANACFLI